MGKEYKSDAEKYFEWAMEVERERKERIRSENTEKLFHPQPLAAIPEPKPLPSYLPSSIWADTYQPARLPSCPNLIGGGAGPFVNPQNFLGGM